jgi:hypothetical protein
MTDELNSSGMNIVSPVVTDEFPSAAPASHAGVYCLSV